MASPEIKFIPHCCRYTASQGNESKLAHIHIHIHISQPQIDKMWGTNLKLLWPSASQKRGLLLTQGTLFGSWHVSQKIPNLKNKPKFPKKCKNPVKIAENPCFETFSL